MATSSTITSYAPRATAIAAGEHCLSLAQLAFELRDCSRAICASRVRMRERRGCFAVIALAPRRPQGRRHGVSGDMPGNLRVASARSPDFEDKAILDLAKRRASSPRHVCHQNRYAAP
jgi:hypothetical protein